MSNYIPCSKAATTRQVPYREEKIRSGVGDHRLQRRRAKPQSLGEYRPHHGITGNHQSEENNPNHGDELWYKTDSAEN